MKIKLLRFACFMAVLCLSVAFLSSHSSADDVKDKWSIGLNFPGLSVKYGLDSNVALEVKVQYLEGVLVAGPRAYYLFTPESPLVFYVGAEVAGIFFDTENTNGVGYAAEAFGGAEYFVGQLMSLDNLTISADLGPAYISVTQDDLTESGVDVILNVSLNWYF